MKKIFNILINLLLIVTISGCSLGNTPSKKVEDFLDKYKNEDKGILTELKNMIDSDGLMNSNEKDTYTNIIRKQYKDLTYEIKDEKINGNKAVVTTEIEVYDFYKTNKEALDYFNNNKQEFLIDNSNNTSDNASVDNNSNNANNANNAYNDSAAIDNTKFIDYRLGRLGEVKDRIKYQIDFNLTKKNNKWSIDDIDDATRQKIHGLFEH